jgi:hypothetical protein
MRWFYTYGLDPAGFEMGYADRGGYLEADTADDALKQASLKEYPWLHWEQWEREYTGEDFISHYNEKNQRYWVRLEQAT